MRAVLTPQAGFAVGVTEFEASAPANSSNGGGEQVNLVGQTVSLQATTPEYTDRFVRRQGDLGVTEVVSASSPDSLRQDATFRVANALGGSDYVSLEARNFPGRYLRHANSRVRIDPAEDNSGFLADATWCVRSGLPTTGASLEAKAFPGRYLRHFNAEVWLAQSGGPLPSDAPFSFDEDVSWNPVTA